MIGETEDEEKEPIIERRIDETERGVWVVCLRNADYFCAIGFSKKAFNYLKFTPGPLSYFFFFFFLILNLVNYYYYYFNNFIKVK